MKRYIAALTILAVAIGGCSKDSSETSSFDTKNDAGTGQGGSLARFALVGDHLYAVNGRSLKVFNISDSENPGFLSSSEVGADVETIFARDSKTLFIGSRTGMFIYDATNAPNIELLSNYSHVTSCDPVVANSNYAYVTLRTRENEVGCGRSNVNQLDVVNIQDLRRIQLVNEVSMDFPIGLGLYGDTLLVCDEGIKVFDISNGAEPKLISQEQVNAVDIIPFGDLMIVSTISGMAQYRFKNGKLEFLSKI